MFKLHPTEPSVRPTQRVPVCCGGVQACLCSGELNLKQPPIAVNLGSTLSLTMLPGLQALAAKSRWAQAEAAQGRAIDPGLQAVQQAHQLLQTAAAQHVMAGTTHRQPQVATQQA